MAANIAFVLQQTENKIVEMPRDKALEAAKKEELRRLMYERIAAGNAMIEAEDSATHLQKRNPR